MECSTQFWRGHLKSAIFFLYSYKIRVHSLLFFILCFIFYICRKNKYPTTILQLVSKSPGVLGMSLSGDCVCDGCGDDWWSEAWCRGWRGDGHRVLSWTCAVESCWEGWQLGRGWAWWPLWIPASRARLPAPRRPAPTLLLQQEGGLLTWPGDASDVCLCIIYTSIAIMFISLLFQINMICLHFTWIALSDI